MFSSFEMPRDGQGMLGGYLLPRFLESFVFLSLPYASQLLPNLPRAQLLVVVTKEGIFKVVIDCSEHEL